MIRSSPKVSDLFAKSSEALSQKMIMLHSCTRT